MTLYARGEVDLSVVQRHAHLLAAHQGSIDAVDVREVTFVDCSGVAMLQGLRAALPPGTGLTIRGTHHGGPVHDLLTILGLRPHFVFTHER
ncbi:hypothetical protein [uncultured Pseudokineococcus sp.]|uniref:hypothetical protein n=1 Tax=uncultured Pseudokineococcus sp. TaxID=1642928 RepID=UPI0026373C60|nr:hypothetical protein [uncultured Pseudokineococcus sp.]